MAITSVQLKLEKKLHRAFKAWCANNGTTMQAAIVQMIEKAIARRPAKG